MKKLTAIILIIFIFNITGYITAETTYKDPMDINNVLEDIERKEIGLNRQIEINAMIPLEQNAYNLLWGIQWLQSLTGGKNGPVMGLRAYFGYAKAAEKPDNSSITAIRYFGLYEKKIGISDDSVVRFVFNPSALLINLEFLTGLKYKISNFFERKQYVNLILGITIVNMEQIYGTFFNEKSPIMFGNYFGFLEPDVSIEIISEIPRFWFMEKPYVKLSYGIQIVEPISRIGNKFEMINYIRVGIGNE
ncbi:MAG: hypothetical protein N3E50_03660 [Candidatus Goldbacteria bacterium]|nr:hypothetical protein [Candidatus Goldiibacteriota bacterium]